MILFPTAPTVKSPSWEYVWSRCLREIQWDTVLLAKRNRTPRLYEAEEWGMTVIGDRNPNHRNVEWRTSSHRNKFPDVVDLLSTESLENNTCMGNSKNSLNTKPVDHRQII